MKIVTSQKKIYTFSNDSDFTKKIYSNISKNIKKSFSI